MLGVRVSATGPPGKCPRKCVLFEAAGEETQLHCLQQIPGKEMDGPNRETDEMNSRSAHAVLDVGSQTPARVCHGERSSPPSAKAPTVPPKTM